MISLDNGASFVEAGLLSEDDASRVAADMAAAAIGCPDLWQALERSHSAGAECNIDFVRIVDETFPGYVLP